MKRLTLFLCLSMSIWAMYDEFYEKTPRSITYCEWQDHAWNLGQQPDQRRNFFIQAQHNPSAIDEYLEHIIMPIEDEKERVMALLAFAIALEADQPNFCYETCWSICIDHPQLTDLVFVAEIICRKLERNLGYIPSPEMIKLYIRSRKKSCYQWLTDWWLQKEKRT